MSKDPAPFSLIPENYPVDPEYHARRARRNKARETETLIPAPGHICPRCKGEVPVPGKAGEYEGAWSRTDNRTEICSQCGMDEGREDVANKLIPQSAWPVKPSHTSSSWNSMRGITFSAPTPRPLPKEVPDLRLHLLDRWVEGGVFWRAVDMRLMVGHLSGPVLGHAAWERRTLADASLWWVKDEMFQLTLAASKSIPEETTGQDVVNILPAPEGMAVLEKTWLGVDSETDKSLVKVDVFTWGISHLRGRKSLSMSSYRYMDFGLGLSQAELSEAVETGAFGEVEQEIKYKTNGDPTARLRGGSWMYLGRSDWPLDDTLIQILDRGDDLPVTTERNASLEEDRRVLAAFAVLINHKLTERETVYSQRQVKRRSERAGVKDRAESNVVLVRLREIRKQSDSGEPSDGHKHVEWKHRWFSSGHMGWRWYGPDRQQKRLVYISPSIKGPADLPLSVKETVNVWVQ